MINTAITSHHSRMTAITRIQDLDMVTHDNRGQDYGYDSRYDSRSGRNYYEQPGGNPNYGYDNRGGRDYYGQPEGKPKLRL